MARPAACRSLAVGAASAASVAERCAPKKNQAPSRHAGTVLLAAPEIPAQPSRSPG